MNNEIILKKAIEKAVKGGWDMLRFEAHNPAEWKIEIGAIPRDKSRDKYCSFDFEKIIFSNSFAKAFWGEHEICTCGAKAIPDDDRFKKSFVVIFHICPHKEHRDNYVWQIVIAWQYHLQQMVLKSDPLEYLGKFLEEEKNDLPTLPI